MKRAFNGTTILLVSQIEQDHSYLGSICGRFGQALSARTCTEAIHILATENVGVVICDARLPDGSWRNLLELGQCRLRPPQLIVTSLTADEGFWAEVLNLGGYDVLPKPFHEDETTRVIHLAAEHWERDRRTTPTAA